jgi:23S rRNA (pseudouridine1915-N3)-methyltransferase
VRLKLISVGKGRSDPTAPLVADYVARIRKFVPFEEIVLKTDADARVAERMRREAEKSDLLVALDERGEQLTSREFSALVGGWMNRGLSEVTLVIGGADGLPPAIRDAADLRLGLSRMTLPHRLARLVLVEQLYRALATLRNVPYQK